MKRDADYYRERLRGESPAIYADLLAGKYRSVRAASIAAGLVQEQTPEAIAKRGWKRMSRSEKANFVRWGVGELKPAVKPRTGSISKSVLADAEGKLSPDTIKRIMDIMVVENLELPAVARQMGFNTHDYRWSRIFFRRDPLHPEFATQLQHWLSIRDKP